MHLASADYLFPANIVTDAMIRATANDAIASQRGNASLTFRLNNSSVQIYRCDQRRKTTADGSYNRLNWAGC